ncbi:hypothetical protein AC579_3605 [Pseudocercospora musae]|uniref:ASST-domain-containing protein n=1 Tax=Pseudocercospora musae TaxID=113226 RepID=A0A139IT25_9PEZI|nr:hypothetical protein AC579_3605 [Pseudocercospora musae]
MAGASWLQRLLVLPTLLYFPFFTYAGEQAIDHKHDNDDSLSKFVTRPELKAPKWIVNVTDERAVTPGYWFVAPFEYIDQKDPANGWVGPHIYDGKGDLVWSGVSVEQGWDALDFRISNVRGQDMLTWLVQKTGDGIIMDNTYTLQKRVDVGTLGVDFNSHEFNFFDGGSKAIVLDEGRGPATAEQLKAVDYEKNCTVLFNGFRILDTSTWQQVFNWTSNGHIGLEESSKLDGGVNKQCTNGWGWDFLHANSVDQDHNGDFFVSGRHTDTIYKVSRHDGHVMWKLHGLGGTTNDFDMGEPPVRFGRQHNVRFRGFNGTHEIISLLDNANGQDERAPTSENSRGMIIALETGAEAKRASIVSQIEHPYGHGHYAPRRGNYQILDNKNIFIGWSEQATQSEHTPDGRMVMEARLATEWLGSYRSYKFPFVGRPTEPPAVHSVAHASDSRNTTLTTIHMSQNGATEIDHWKVYKTTEKGSPKIPIFQMQKTGFETAIVWDGFASHVIVEAIDKQGRVLATSEIVQTIGPGQEDLSGAVADELYWLQELEGDHSYGNVYAASVSALAGYTLAIFLLGAMSSIVLVVLIFRWQRRGGSLKSLRFGGYSPLTDQEMGQGPRTPRRGHYPKPSRDMGTEPFFRDGV